MEDFVEKNIGNNKCKKFFFLRKKTLQILLIMVNCHVQYQQGSPQPKL